MSGEPAGGRSTQEVLALLKDPEFCAAAEHVMAAFPALVTRASSPNERQQLLEQLCQPFVDRWGVPPPTSPELLDADPRRSVVDAIASGRWGLLPVFTWTRNFEIQARAETIRRFVGKRHKDAVVDRMAQLVGWLWACRFPRPAIAQELFQRQTDLCRPTISEAIERTPEDRERQLYREYAQRSLDYTEIEQLIYRTLQGSEALASAAVRMIDTRYVERMTELDINLTTPIESDPLSHALTMLFRVLPEADDFMVRQLATDSSSAFEKAMALGGATPLLEPRDTLVAARWGLGPMFAWTTVLEIRAAATTLRTMMKSEAQGGGATFAGRSLHFEPVSDVLIRLWRAVDDRNDVRTRRFAHEARDAFLRIGLR